MPTRKLPMSRSLQNESRLKPLLHAALWTLFLALLAAPALAQSPEEKGLAIAQEADQRNEGFGDTSATLQMILRNRHGEESKREIRSKVLETRSDGDKSLIVFDQ